MLWSKLKFNQDYSVHFGNFTDEYKIKRVDFFFPLENFKNLQGLFI